LVRRPGGRRRPGSVPTRTLHTCRQVVGALRSQRQPTVFNTIHSTSKCRLW
jgi:hypothetical protein